MMIAGHKKQWNFLSKEFELDQLAHAYLFSGEEKIGKRTLAKEFIKLINCLSVRSSQAKNDKDENEKPRLRQGYGGQACGICKNCKDIENENYLDVLTVNLKDDKQEIEISQIREALNFLSYKSYYGGFKSVIINNSERMTIEAQNCFLKTLEEPKGKTILILVSSHPEILLSTIISRCQIIKFYSVDQKEIESYLIKIGAKEKIAHTLASFCSHNPGKAVDLFFNPEILEREQKTLQELIKVINSDLAEKFQYAKKVNLEGNNLKRILEILQRYLRHLLFLKTGIVSLTPKDYLLESTSSFKNYSISKIKEVLKLLETLNTQTSLTNASPKLALEILLMEM